MRDTVGYVRVFSANNLGSAGVQRKFIERYCAQRKIGLSRIFSDIGVKRNRCTADKWKARVIGITPSKGVNTFPGWDDMMISATHGNIGTIIVDTKLRLYSGQMQKEALERICREQDISIMETESNDFQTGSTLEQVAIYHYSMQKGLRTSIPLNDIDSLYEAVSCHPEWEVAALYLDEDSVKRRAYPELKETDGYGIVFVKSLYHIKRLTITFLEDMRYFRSKGVCVYSEEEGQLIYGDAEAAEWLSRPLRVVAYDWQRSGQEVLNQEILLKKFRVFARIKTNGWTIVDTFIDGLDGNQTNLQRLVQKPTDYDIILVDTFSKIGDTVICLARILKEVQIPIYSLREGGISLYG